jgi:hypothetical protein
MDRAVGARHERGLARGAIWRDYDRWTPMGIRTFCICRCLERDISLVPRRRVLSEAA